jgi:hypothetical protein
VTAREREELRRRIDAAVRRRTKGRCEDGWTNPETGYRNGCRCDFCRYGTAEARRARKGRRLRRQVAA